MTSAAAPPLATHASTEPAIAPAPNVYRPLSGDLVVSRRADGRTLGCIAFAAILFDGAVRTRPAGVVAAAAAMAVPLGILATGRIDRGVARAFLLAASLFGVWLGLRTTGWLLAVDLAVGLALSALGVAFARDGAPFCASFPMLTTRAMHVVGHLMVAPDFVIPSVQWRARRRELRPWLRGLSIAIPLAAVFYTLFASADRVFAGVFRLNVDVSRWMGHAVLFAIGSWLMSGLIRAASGGTPGRPATAPRPLGQVETELVLGIITLVFGAFAVSQLVVVLDGARTVLERQGLTYAAYARQGFFQLVAIAIITIVALTALRAARRRDSGGERRFLALALVVIGLNLLVVYVAFRRLSIYVDELGLTPLRIVTLTATVAIGCVLVLLAFSFSGVGRTRDWFPMAAVAVVCAAVLVLNLLNPAATIARHNIARLQAGERLDAPFLSELSDDAVPAIMARVDGLARPDRQRVLNDLCARLEQPSGWASTNRARSRAIDALRAPCAEFLSEISNRFPEPTQRLGD